MLICYPHYRSSKYICDQPGIRVGFFGILVRVLGRPIDRRTSKYVHCLAALISGSADVRFYFDFHDASGILRDALARNCQALPSHGRKRSVGQAVKDLTYRGSEGRIVVEVHNGEGPNPQGLGSRRNDRSRKVRHPSFAGSQEACSLSGLHDLDCGFLARTNHIRIEWPNPALDYPRHNQQSRVRKFEQVDEWSFCLAAGALVPANQERR